MELNSIEYFEFIPNGPVERIFLPLCMCSLASVHLRLSPASMVLLLSPLLVFPELGHVLIGHMPLIRASLWHSELEILGRFFPHFVQLLRGCSA